MEVCCEQGYVDWLVIDGELPVFIDARPFVGVSLYFIGLVPGSLNTFSIE
jgi:hypothetical protein